MALYNRLIRKTMTMKTGAFACILVVPYENLYWVIYTACCVSFDKYHFTWKSLIITECIFILLYHVYIFVLNSSSIVMFRENAIMMNNTCTPSKVDFEIFLCFGSLCSSPGTNSIGINNALANLDLIRGLYQPSGALLPYLVKSRNRQILV